VSAFESSASADRQRGDETDRAVADGDLKIKALEGKLRDAQGQIDTLAKERANAEAALQEHQAAHDASIGTPEPTPGPTPEPTPQVPPQTEAVTGDTRLRAAEQQISSLENSIKDRDFRIDSLMQDAAALEAKLEVYRAEDEAQDQPEEASGEPYGEPSEYQSGVDTTEAREVTR
jgi:DNA repair exonuclease SbcCD ATPase subunit